MLSLQLYVWERNADFIFGNMEQYKMITIMVVVTVIIIAIIIIIIM